MSDSEDASIFDNLQKTRELWNNKADSGSPEYLKPKSPASPIEKPVKPSSPDMENHVNGHGNSEDIVRFEDRMEDDFDLPDVKSMKSQFEKAGSVPAPKKQSQPVKRSQSQTHDRNPSPELVPVNREPEETKEEYEIQLGALREKFENEAKAANAKIVFPDGPRSEVSKAAVDQRVNIFEVEIEAQKHYQSTKEGLVEMPAVELSSIKKQFEQRKDEKMVVPKRSPSTKKSRQSSVSSDTAPPPTNIVRHDDPLEDEVKIEVDTKSIRNRFEQSATQQSKPQYRSYNTVQKKTSSESNTERSRSVSDSENIEIVKSSDAKFDEMIGEESVKDRLASLNSRYKAMMDERSQGQNKAAKNTYKRRSTTNLVIKEKIREEDIKPVQDQEVELVRSPPAGTKEKPDYDSASIDLAQTRQLFEQRSASPSSGRSRSSRSSSSSPGRRPPRSKSTPSPVNRGSRSSSQSPSPVRDGARSSASSSSGRGSPKPRSKKKFGDPDVVVLEHSEVNYYYEDGKRLSSKLKGPDDYTRSSQEEENMSSVDLVKPAPAGTKEDVDFVPSVDIHSVRDMFERPQVTEKRGRSPPKKTIIIEREDSRPQSQMSLSPERNPDIVRSTTAGTREEPIYEMSVDLKSARSKFESPHRAEEYIPRNTIRQREEEARQRRAAAAAASPRTSESSDGSSLSDVVKTTEAGSKEKPEYQVDLKATKSLFEGGRVPVPVTVKREAPKRQEVHGEVVRPEPAGTKEVVEINGKKDIKSFKKKFESTETVKTDDKRKDPIDIKEEARMVVQKEKEVKEEVEKHQTSSSESGSEKGDEKVLDHPNENGLNEYERKEDLLIEAAAEDGLKENEGKPVDNKLDLVNDSNEVANHVNDSSSSDDQKGISSSSSNLDDSQQQLSLSSSSQQEDITGKTDNDLTDITQTTIPFSQNGIVDPFAGFDNIVGPPQLSPSENFSDPFGGFGNISGDNAKNINDPFDPFSSSDPVPAPRKKTVVDDVKSIDNSLVDTSEDEDYDRPHFNYPYDDEDSGSVPTIANQNMNASNNNDFNLFDTSGDASVNAKPSSGPDLLAAFDSPPSNNTELLLADFGVTSTTSATLPQIKAPASDPFDIFSTPGPTQQSSTAEKDPFDLFA